MSGRWATLDLGNSALKLRVWRAGAGGRPELVDAAERALAVDEAPALAQELARRAPELERVALASVAAPELERALAAALSARFAARFSAAPPTPTLELALRRPETLGQDRRYAALAAVALLGCDVVVIDAGTCVTVDAVQRLDAQRARFLGGAIVPGPRLLAQALARGGARLPELEVGPGFEAGAAALGRDTEQALRAGVVVGLRGAVRELIERVGAEAGFGAVPLVWTGGARALLLEPPLWPARPARTEPELVHLGLLAALGVPLA